MEMLVVVAIIVALAGLGGYYFIGQLNESKVSSAKVQSQNIAKAINTYFIDNYRWPDNLQVLLEKTPEGKGPYLTTRDAIMDPWGNVFQYDQSGQKNLESGATVVI